MKKVQGFTLIEVLLVVAAIAILAGIVILAVNPTKQLADARDTKRQADVNTLLNAVYEYAIDNDGTIPAAITTTATEICATSETNNVNACTSLANISEITDDQTYLSGMPSDPGGGCATNGVCYEISRSENGRVTVSAPDAENSTISATR